MKDLTVEAVCKLCGITREQYEAAKAGRPLPKARSAPNAQAGEEVVANVADLFLTAAERGVCGRLGMDAGRFLLGKLGETGYDELVNAAGKALTEGTQANAMKAVAAVMQVLCNAPADGLQRHRLYDGSGMVLGPALPLA